MEILPGLTFLRPRVASWRYTRGSRSLAVTLGGIAAAGDIEPITSPPDDDDQDIPQEVHIYLILIHSLKNYTAYFLPLTWFAGRRCS